MPHYVYVMINSDGRRYIGMSCDVAVRVRQHNEGLSQWTAKHGPWKLIWQIAPMPRSDALRLEKKLKRQGGGSGFYRKEP